MVPYKPIFSDGWSPGVVILPDHAPDFGGGGGGHIPYEEGPPRRMESTRSSEYLKKVRCVTALVAAGGPIGRFNLNAGG